MSSVATGRKWCGLFNIGVMIVLCVIRGSHAGNAVSLNKDNIESILRGNEIVFVNFYADWCRFSQILGPVFDEASKKVADAYPETGKVVLAKVDCDTEVDIASKYHISKYPTLKLYRNGEVTKKEYRGQRTADALANFIHSELKNPMVEHSALEQLKELDRKKRNVVGYFDSKESDNYKTFARIAGVLRDDCSFHVALGGQDGNKNVDYLYSVPADQMLVGNVSAPERVGGDRINFIPSNSDRQDIVFMGPMNNYDQLHAWTYEKCVPLVREITFDNAEALTEEGLPFLLLFHHPDDTAIVETFNNEVAKQLLSEKNSVNFLVADGTKFTHPLQHLGKSLDDLPVLAIDSFRHMYLFPHNTKTDLEKPGLLKTFIEDLHSGKLHREFHHGPDPTPPKPSPPSEESKTAEQGGGDGQKAKIGQPHLPKQPDQPIPQDQQQAQKAKQTQPPESTFKKLAPSRSRYTILRDEL